MTKVAGFFAVVLLVGTAVRGAGVEHNAANSAQPRFCNRAEYHQFDFWLGDWDSYDAHGVLQGHNLVQKVLDGCAIQEWWFGTDGAVGSSFSIFDAPRSVWNQTWVSNHGTLLPIEGGRSGTSMVLWGNHVAKDGSLELHRTIWTPDSSGGVHQLWDSSTDGGRKWQINYEGYLRPAKKPFDKSVAYRAVAPSSR